MTNESNINVSVRQFVTALIENSAIKTQTTDYIEYAYQTGWLEDMDVTGSNEPLLRKTAARIAHEFMRLELHEPDSENVNASDKLRDLYDCRICTKHIMQAVTKGIMEGYYITDSLYLFGINDKITYDEMHAIINRVFHHTFRINT